MTGLIETVFSRLDPFSPVFLIEVNMMHFQLPRPIPLIPVSSAYSAFRRKTDDSRCGVATLTPSTA